MILIDDIRSAFWQLYRHGWSTASCVACLSIGVAVVTSVASILNGILIQPLPFHDANRLVMIRSEHLTEQSFNRQVSRMDFYDWREESETMQMTAFVLGRFDLPHEGGFQRLRGLYVSDSFFEVLDLRPFLGVDFRDYEITGNRRQIMLHPSLWRTRLGADPSVVGDVIKLNTWDAFPQTGSQEYALCGLLPDGMRSPPSSSWIDVRGIGPDRPLQFVVPLRVDRDWFSQRSFRDVDVLARLKPGVSVAEAQAEIDLICARLAARYPQSNEGWTARVVPLDEYFFSSVRPFVVAGFAAAILVFSIGMANVVHLLLVQYHHRQAELAIRVAVGATPWQLVRQSVTEFLILLGMAFAVGTLAGGSMTSILLTMAPPSLRWLPTAVQANVVSLTLLLALGGGLLVWYVTLRHVLSPNLSPLLGASPRTASRDRRSMRTLVWMTRGQLLGTYLLLLGAGLLWMRTRELARVDPGFSTANRLSMTISLPQAKHEWNYNSVFCNDVIDRVRNLPGVNNAAAILGLPMGNSALVAELSVEGRPLIRPGDLPKVFVRVITDDYFETMGIPMIRGRKFGPTDAIGEIGNNRTAIINHTMAEKCWPRKDPLGRRFKPFRGASWMEVVGVVGDVHSDGLDRGITIDIYYPEKLFPQSHISLVVHTQNDPMALAADVRRAVRQAESDAHVSDQMTLDNVVAASMANRRFGLQLLGALSGIGLALALFGVVLTTAHVITCRRSELSVRIACGATPWHVLGVVLSQQAASVAAAIGIGVLLGIGITSSLHLPWNDLRFFRSLAFAFVPGLLAAAALGVGFLVTCRIALARGVQI